MATNETAMLKLYEDIGSLKALFTSIDKKLDGVMEEFKSLREEQVQVKLEVSSGSESITRIEESVTAVEKRVDQLVALRHRIGGAMFLVTMTGGAVFSAWEVVARFVTGLMHVPK
jgi:predicted  nucleic acid-binding Zn-ribbon protein